jgi:hypothetical protein
MTDNRSPEIEKLNHHNYVMWRNIIRPTLRSVEAYRIATGEELYPDGNTVAIRKEQRDFEKRAALGAKTILSSCTTEIMTRIMHLDGPREMWESLREEFDNEDSQAARTTIRHRFDNSRLGENEKVGVYFTRLRTLRQQLTGTTDAIDDQAFRGHIFKTLRPISKFRTIITFLQATRPPPTPDHIMRTVQTDEEETDAMSLTTGGDIGDTLTTAEGLHASGRGGRRGRGRGRSPRGRGRGRGGRFSSEKRDDREDDTSDSDKRCCFHCGISGHIKADCPHRKRALQVHGPYPGPPAKKQDTGSALIGDMDAGAF